ncbi:MAG: hypothetical protein PHW53_03105 [Patescibacteria group bacterium]|nr:hypothetical protein [Patescibacteria group bacterium]
MSRKHKEAIAHLKAIGVIRGYDIKSKLPELERTSTFLRFPPPPDFLRVDPSTDRAVMDEVLLRERASLHAMWAREFDQGMAMEDRRIAMCEYEEGPREALMKPPWYKRLLVRLGMAKSPRIEP